MQKITLTPLTAEAFKPYGDVIETESRDYFMINNGSTRRYHQLGDVDTSDEAGNTIISIFQATPVQYPLRVTMMERHPLGSQAFMPLLGNPYLILVAQLTGDLETDKLNPENIRGFISNGKQGVNYHKGVWHHPVLAFTGAINNKELILVGEGNNCEEIFFAADDIRTLDKPTNY